MFTSYIYMKSFFLFIFKIKFKKNSNEIYVFWAKRIEYVQAYPYTKYV